MTNLTSVIFKFYDGYLNTTPKKLKIIDSYLLYVLLTGIVQFLYCCLVGTFPFNSFLSGFISTVSCFVLGVCLRLQVNPQNKSQFSGISPERGFADFIFAHIVLHIVVVNFIGEVLANEIFYRTCTDILHKNDTECIPLLHPGNKSSTNELEGLVQPISAKILMTRSLIEACLPAALSLMLGPWSDKYGRKPLIVVPFLGYLMMYIISATLASLSHINPWWYILPSIAVAVSGGQCSLITGSFCYLTDTIQEEKRAIRMGIVEAAVYIGLLIGALSAPLIYNSFGSVIVFAIAAMSILIGLFYCCAFIQESVIMHSNLGNSRIRGLLDFSLASDMIRVCCKSRLHWDRAIIWMLMITLGSTILVLEGNAIVNYMFVREKFHWTITEYTRYNSASIVLTIVGTCLGIYILNKILRIDDLMLSILSQISSISEAILKSIAYEGWHLYLGAALSMLRGCFGPMTRAFLSKIVPTSDIGKIFSLATSIESVSPLAASPVYTLLYTNTFKYFPGAYNVLTASVYGLNIILLLIVHRLYKTNRTYESLNTNSNT